MLLQVAGDANKSSLYPIFCNGRLNPPENKHLSAKTKQNKNKNKTNQTFAIHVLTIHSFLVLGYGTNCSTVQILFVRFFLGNSHNNNTNEKQFLSKFALQ